MRRKDNSTLVSLIRHKEASLVLMIILLMAVITMANVSFLTYGNINDIMRSYSVHGIVAMGMLLVIITSGIDVSVGSMAAAVTVIVGDYLLHREVISFLHYWLDAFLELPLDWSMDFSLQNYAFLRLW